MARPRATQEQRKQLRALGLHQQAQAPNLTRSTAKKRIKKATGPHPDPHNLRPTRAETKTAHTSYKQRQHIRERDEHRCRYCGTAEGPFEVDHVFPVWYGGSSILDNLVLACKPCNRDKGKRLDWWGVRQLADENHEWAKKALLRAESLEAVRRWAEAQPQAVSSAGQR